MANNRLYLVDEKTGDAILLAKGYGSWGLWPDSELLSAFLEAHDFGAAAGTGIRTNLKLMTEDDPGIPPSETWKPTP